jgi:lipopolysaccharide transport system ATP-binding protein
MRARLEFAIATAIKPDILVIDEVLGAGDGYFARKCATRIHTLTERSTLLLVSHSMQQILSFCDRAIWLNDGRIVEDGAPATVIKAYESYMARRDASIQAATGPDELPPGSKQMDDLSRQKALLDTRKTTIQQKSEDLLGKHEPIDKRGPSLLWVAFEPSDEQACSVETGGSVCIRVRVRVPDRLGSPLSLSVVAFSENGSPMWRSHELALPDAGGEYDALLSTEQVIAGVGGYFLSICLKQGKDGDRALIDVKHACLHLQLVTTNYSDPPLFHCPARWRYGKAPGVVADGRVSGWV